MRDESKEKPSLSDSTSEVIPNVDLAEGESIVPTDITDVTLPPHLQTIAMGLGEGMTSPARVRDMCAKALRNRYPLTPEMRTAVVLVLTQTLLAPDSSKRDRTNAARALILADATDERKDRAEADAKQSERQLQLSALRAALATPEGRAALAHLTQMLPSLPDPSSTSSESR